MAISTENIESIIYGFLPDKNGYEVDVTTAMEYAYKAGGKRIRPMLMKLSYDMLGGSNKAIYNFMAAIEMIHTYSLIHDDLPALDNDELRRGKPTVHVTFGEDIAILAGDGLLNYAFETAAKAFNNDNADIQIEKAFRVLASKPGVYGMIGGQTLDVTLSGKKPDNSQIEYIYRNKTAALIEGSLMIGAYLAGANDEIAARFEEAGYAIGMAFQVMDDILDITGDEAKLGKPVNSDNKNNKVTFVSINGMDYSRSYVKEMSEKAEEIIMGINASDESSRDDLIRLIDSLINRDR